MTRPNRLRSDPDADPRDTAMIATRRNREAEMSPAVSSWLSGMGYDVYAEVCVTGLIDHVGVRWADESIICVEMKCTMSRKVLGQASVNQLITPLSYIAVPTKPRSLERAKFYGLGVWANGQVILEPKECRRIAMDSYRERALDACRMRAPGGIGGLPTLKGDGPAIRVALAVAAYLKDNPGADWKELFAKVPNHYAHHRSMQGAVSWKMTKLAKE